MRGVYQMWRPGGVHPTRPQKRVRMGHPRFLGWMRGVRTTGGPPDYGFFLTLLIELAGFFLAATVPDLGDPF
jgi:hypothetical protein